VCIHDTAGGAANGICIGGASNGLACDVGATNASFPAAGSLPSGGGRYSLDCLPAVGVNVSGTGLAITLNQTTGTSSLASALDCDGDDLGTDQCPCLSCSRDSTIACSADAECTAQGNFCSVYTQPTFYDCSVNGDCGNVSLGTCTAFGNTRCSGAFNKLCATNTDCGPQSAGACVPSTCSSIGSAGTIPASNACDGAACSDTGNGEGQCTTGPDDKFCDGVVRADGTGISACFDNTDCASFGAGACTLARRRNCFVDPIVATGDPDPGIPIVATTFCAPPGTNNPVNTVVGWPGPNRLISQQSSTAWCASDHGVAYVPGVGGCP
jgi:hypothetical protein